MKRKLLNAGQLASFGLIFRQSIIFGTEDNFFRRRILSLRDLSEDVYGFDTLGCGSCWPTGKKGPNKFWITGEWVTGFPPSVKPA